MRVHLGSMRSLFLKIFLAFWLTAVLVELALVLAWSLEPEQVVQRWRSLTGDALAIYATSAAQIAEKEGPRPLAAYLDRLHSNYRIHAVLLDAEGNPLNGSVTAEERKLALSAQTTGSPELLIKSRQAIGAQRATGPSGKAYILVAELPRRSVGPFSGPFSRQARNWTIALLVSGLICYLLTRYLTGPVLRLRLAARHIAAGDLSARAPDKLGRRHDELGELVRDFNEMAFRIEELVRSQQQLIRDISHELRSPLARLTMALGLARDRQGAESHAALDRIEREAERLNEMIGRLLVLARIQAATAPPEKTPVSLATVVSDVAEDAEFEAQGRGCNVICTVKSDCVVMGSQDLLRSAVENVVRNALRYTVPHSAVEITLECNNGGPACILVRDHGPGIPEPELTKVFRPFYRVASARDRQSGGTGIGLAIAEGAMRLHGGSVKAANANGGGLEVTFSVPVKNGASG
ncbi:MAG: HAMP domain-containing protein [Acidobacteria bacterium]|nr:HAMP domain-containing protein [Acidobacteriota bacterium]